MLNLEANVTRNMLHNNPVATTSKGSWVALAALGILALTVVGLPVFIAYFLSHTFTNNTSAHNQSDLEKVISHIGSSALKEAILTSANKHIGKDLPDRSGIAALRTINTNFEITPVASNGKKINGLLVHEKQLGDGAYSIVKKGHLITLTQGGWQAKEVAVHEGKSEGDYSTEWNNDKLQYDFGQISKLLGVYDKDILLHEEFFGNKTHPNVESMPIGYGWLDEDREYMVHDLRQGDLDSVPCESSEKLFDFIRGIVEGLNFYHENDILFRDLKSQNILIDFEGRPILSDPKEAKAGAVMEQAGSVPFHAPELFENNSQSKASDMYALGVVLLDMKNKYLINALASAKGEEKQCLIEEINQKISHSRKLHEERSRENDKSKQTSWHDLHTKRLMDSDAQNKLLDQIDIAGGFKNEDIYVVKFRLEYLDKIISKLLHEKPEERPNTIEVIQDFAQNLRIAKMHHFLNLLRQERPPASLMF